MFLLIFLIKTYILNIFDFFLPQQFGMKHQREQEYTAKIKCLTCHHLNGKTYEANYLNRGKQCAT